MNIKILSKDELNEQMGAVSFWKSKPVLQSLTYFSGITGFDELPKPIIVPKILLIKYPIGLEIQMMVGFKTFRTGIFNKDIVNIQLEEREQIFEQKEKSVIGRALIGGLLLGPLGAVVGGMSGIGSKEVKSRMPELLLSISLNCAGEIGLILFSCPHEKRSEVSNYFSKNYPEHYNL